MRKYEIGSVEELYSQILECVAQGDAIGVNCIERRIEAFIKSMEPVVIAIEDIHQSATDVVERISREISIERK